MNRLSLTRKIYQYSFIELAITAGSLAMSLSYNMRSRAGIAEIIGIVCVAMTQ